MGRVSRWYKTFAYVLCTRRIISVDARPLPSITPQWIDVYVCWNSSPGRTYLPYMQIPSSFQHRHGEIETPNSWLDFRIPKRVFVFTLYSMDTDDVLIHAHCSRSYISIVPYIYVTTHYITWNSSYAYTYDFKTYAQHRRCARVLM